MSSTGWAAARSWRGVAVRIGIGLLAGLLSGLFGVGGGTVVVPLLVLLLGFNQRLAAGTALGAMVPTALVGMCSYALGDAVAWVPALLLAVGAVGGAQIGTWLLPRVSQTALRWGFVGLLAAVIIPLFLVIPSRGAEFTIDWWSGVAIVATGIATGAVSGLIGVGGGIIVVPVLMLGFAASDLVAKGTSLAMMIPAAVSGTAGNFRQSNVDLVSAAYIGFAACATTALGAWLARLVDPSTGNILFAVLLVFVAVQMAVRPGRDNR